MPYINEDQFGQPYPQAGERLTRPSHGDLAAAALELRAENAGLRAALRELLGAIDLELLELRVDDSDWDISQRYDVYEMLVAIQPAARRARVVLEGEGKDE